MKSINSKKKFGNYHHSNSTSDDDDDLITIQIQSKTINIFYSQISKYSKRIRDNYLFSDVKNCLPQELLTFQQQNKVDLESIFSFFILLRHNFNINENKTITYKQCLDLLKISEFLGVNKLTKKLQKYIQNHKIDADFIIQMIHLEIENGTYNQKFHINEEMEELLATKIENCLQNDEFADLPIPMIYRVIEKSSQNQVFDDILYDFIKKSIPKFSVLFSFINLKNLSENRLQDLCETYSNSNEETKNFFSFLKCNLEFVMKSNENQKNLQKQVNQLKKKLNEMSLTNDKLKKQLNDKRSLKNKNEEANILLQKELSKSEGEKNQFQKDLNIVITQKNRLQDDFKEMNLQKDKLKKQLDNTKCLIKQKEEVNNQFQKKLNYLNDLKNKLVKQLEETEKSKKQIEFENSQLQKKLANSEKEKQEIQKQLEEEKFKISEEL